MKDPSTKEKQSLDYIVHNQCVLVTVLQTKVPKAWLTDHWGEALLGFHQVKILFITTL